MKKQKLLLCALLVLAMFFPLKTHAQESAVAKDAIFGRETDVDVIVSPKWNGAHTASCYLDVSGKRLTATVLVVPNNNNLYTSGTLYIERKDGNTWVQVASTSVSGTGRVSATKTYTGTSGKTYRARYSGKTGSDSVSSTSTEVTVY
ncbi:MAG: hypothetical protein IK016_10655 [Lachnospiraceae bacterium]|nr:hypothetical protein [Lachnospiraceae bacterium]